MITDKLVTNNRWKNFFIAIIVGISFFLALRPPLDPDLGWHIRTGQYVWENKRVPTTDPFSHTFSEYPVIAHEWLTDVCIYGLSTMSWPVGWLLAAIIFSGLALASFALAAKSVSADPRIQALAVLLGVAVGGPLLGIRPQVVSLLGLGLVLYILYRFIRNEHSRSIYFLPLIFCIWANLHGGFALGLFAFGLVIVAEISRIILKSWYQSIGELATKHTPNVRTLQLKSLLRITAVGVGSGLATLINPYGPRLYREVYTTFIQTSGFAAVRNTISEWQPTTLQHLPGLELLLYSALLLLAMVWQRKRINCTMIFLSAIFLLLALASWRHVPVFMVVSIPLWVVLARNWSLDALDRILKNITVIAATVIVLGLVSWYQVTFYWQKGISSQALAGDYPYDGVKYLKSHLPEGAMYNEYDWGGYLLWSLPSEKVFIDGRMAVWKQGAKNVFRDWEAITLLDENWRGLLESYNINWVILRRGHRIAEILRRDKDWQEVYVDALASVIIRKIPL